MGDVFQPIDLIIFFAALIGVMAVGLIAGRKEDTSEDYFLAGRKIPWWGVAGSIFGSNVSANHMVGMMGIGFSIGFAQSHFELGAILGLMVLCYGFLPVYRKLRVFTLSEYLGRRYDNRSRVAYAIIMVIIMAIVQMVPGLYIGARSICVLMGGDALERVTVMADADATTTKAAKSDAGDADATDSETTTTKSNGPTTKLNVNKTYYALFVIALAVISAAYTIFGGLKAVVWTDVMQSVLLLLAGIAVAILTFQEIGGWGRMIEMDQAGGNKMHLYLPMNHPQLPWTGVFTGLMAMHCFYWGTNQFIVQRALAARSDAEARLGIVSAGFLKLLIPFFAIGTGVAAVYLFKRELPDRTIDPDAAFPELVKLVIPIGSGVIGLIAAGLIGAILSSIDSMMNSAATIVTFDIYKQYINPDASERQMIRIGRLSIVAFVILAAVLAIFVLDPNSQENFFLQIADYQNYLTPGLLVAFGMGMFWPRGTATGAFMTILAGILFSWLVVYGYNNYLAEFSTITAYFGDQLNFFHRVVVVILLCVVVHVVVSLQTTPDAEKGRLIWTDLGGHSTDDLRRLVTAILVSLVVFVVLGLAMVAGWLAPGLAAVLGFAWTVGIFVRGIVRKLRNDATNNAPPDNLLGGLLRDDRFWAGILCATAVFMHYYFY